MQSPCLPAHVPMALPSPVPAGAPTDVEVSRSIQNPRIITMTWRPFTVVEARGFIEYLVQLHEVSSTKRQDGFTQRVPMDQGSTTFTVDDPSINYEASVGTVSLSGEHCWTRVSAHLQRVRICHFIASLETMHIINQS